MTIATGGAARRRASVDDAPRTPLPTSLPTILASKVERPYRRPGIIDRPALLARIRAAPTPLVALVAPAGYGKSTTLSQVADDPSRRTAWFSADGRDSDPATLLLGLAAAIHRVAPLPDDTLAVTRSGLGLWAAAVPRLAAILASVPALALVIDDVDRIDDRDGMDILLALAANLAPGSRLLLGGRSLGRLPQARLIANGQLTVFGREDLAFDPSETGAALVAVAQRPPGDGARRLTDRTEGWAAGVYLSSLAGSDGATGPGSLSPTASARGIEEFLRTEVLGSMSAQEADLVLRASILDRLSGPVCDAVLEREHCGADLDRIERRNLFLIPLDTERTWYRFHHLLADFLRAELERRDPGAVRRLRRRAAIWHAEQGHPEAALEYAMAAEDEDLAARLVVAVGQEAVNRGRLDTVRRWFDWFDVRGVGLRHARFASYAAMTFALEGDMDLAVRWSSIADRAAADATTDGDAGMAAIARVMIMAAGADAMLVDGELAEATTGTDDPFRVAAMTALGGGLMLTGDRVEGRRVLRDAVARFDTVPVANNAATMALVMLAADALARGDRVAAETDVRKARAIHIANDLTDGIIAVAVDALDARLALAHGATEQARADLAHAQRLRPRLNASVPWLAIRARLDLIRAHLSLHDPGGARTLMGEVRDILALRPAMGTLLDEVEELAARLDGVRGGTAGVSTLTLAELRLLPFLTTHLSFREIGERLFISQNTVKTQAISIYRKLEVTSRSEAIDRAVDLGLLEAGAPPERFIPAG